MGGANKKAFDTGRSSMYVMDPIKDLAIAGALNDEFGIPKEQLGELDTECDRSDPLYNMDLGEPIDEDFISNIDAYGVMTPIKICKRDDMAFVVFGRSRVRAARVVNRRRKARGEPPITVKCDIVRGPDALLMGNMIAENEIRRRESSPLTKIDNLLRMLARGVSIKDCAISFGKSEATLQSWIDYNDKASSPVKKAVESGRMSLTTAINVARAGDADAQKKAMDELGAQVPAEGRITNNRAKQAAKRATAAPDAMPYEMSTKRELKKLLEAVEKMDHGKHGEKTIAFWEGVEHAVQLVIGTDKLDERLAKFVDKLREDA